MCAAVVRRLTHGEGNAVMDWLRSGWRRLRQAVSGIPLTDRCLILFMAILLGQSAYSLFAGAPGSPQSGDIDVIVRTASAAIFGYFLSARGRRPAGKAGDGPGDHLVAAAAAIGLFCLVILLALRNLPPEDPAMAGSDSATATVAQFRDFVSGCVGLLIGVPAGRAGTPSGE